jgi:GNAT superfamily N-acetyltransferase
LIVTTTAKGGQEMHDMLVKLYELPSLEDALAATARQGVTVRRALGPEKPVVAGWVQSRFTVFAAEVEIAFVRLPIACFIALRGQQILGFACYDATARNFFGPEAVSEEERGRGLGRALLLAALHAQRAQGHAYAIVGGVGPAEFYAKCVGAVPIPGSSPGIYAGILHQNRPAS